MTATDMINTLKFWTDINGADALIQIGGTTATVHQVCTPSVKVLAMLPTLSMLAIREGSLREYLLEVS